MAVYMAERRASRREILIEHFGGKCQKCGRADNLEFNHLDRATKKFVLSGCHLDKAWKTILEEAAKCELVCQECHLAYTREQYASGEIPAHNKNHDPYVHGTARCYQENACREPLCQLAKREYRAKRLGYTEPVDMTYSAP